MGKIDSFWIFCIFLKNLDLKLQWIDYRLFNNFLHCKALNTSIISLSESVIFADDTVVISNKNMVISVHWQIRFSLLWVSGLQLTG
jgi:hypothetical protein